jgi:4'-phosphopantetheinyl transferase
MNTPDSVVTPLLFRPALPLAQQTKIPSSINCLGKTVHLWGFHLDANPQALAYWRRLLSDEEIQRAERHIDPKQGARRLVAHGLKREVLSRYLHQAPQALKFVVQAHGKPVLRAPGHETWHFNLSHSHDRLLLAISNSRSLGVDLECQDPTRPFLALAQRFFHPDELTTMRTLEEKAARRLFYRTWVAKEALLKAQGSGLKAGLAQWPVPGTEADKAELPPWTVHWLPMAEPGFCAALAVHAENEWVWI